MADSNHYVNGDVTAPNIYELRINNVATVRSGNLPDLCWKARRAVNGSDDRAEVESVSGFYFQAFFSNAELRDWERA